MKKQVLLSLVAGVVLLVWGTIYWTMLPWPTMGINKFTNEAAVAQVLKDNSPQAGMYLLAFPKSENDLGPPKPIQVGAFANLLPHGVEVDMMGKEVLIGFITHIISAFLVLGLLGMTSGLTYWNKVGFFSLTGLTIGFVSHAPYWNWLEFPTSYVGFIILDFLIGWTLAGLAIAKISHGKD